MSNKFPMMSAEIGPIPETEFTKPRSKFVKLSSIRSSKPRGGEDEKKVILPIKLIIFAIIINYYNYY